MKKFVFVALVTTSICLGVEQAEARICWTIPAAVSKWLPAQRRQEARVKEIQAFVSRMPHLVEDRVPQSLWVEIFQALDRVNFSNLPYRVKWKSHEFSLDLKLVRGWRKIGFLTDKNKFDFQITPEQIRQRFNLITDFRSFGEDEGERQILRPESFSALGFEKLIPLDDIHAIIFHSAYLTDPLRRELFEISSAFILLESLALKMKYPEIEDAYLNHGDLSVIIQDHLFEGNGLGPENRVYSAIPFLAKNIQKKKTSPIQNAEKWGGKISLPFQPRDGSIPLIIWEFGGNENDRDDWDPALEIMERAINNSLHDINLLRVPAFTQFAIDLRSRIHRARKLLADTGSE